MFCRSQGLSLTASLKAAQVASDLLLIQSTCNTIVTRILVQQAMQRFYLGNTTEQNFARAATDVASALASGGQSSLLLQSIIYPRNDTGNTHGLLNVTGSAIGASIELPYKYANGSNVILGDPGMGFPPGLYPNLTYVTSAEPDPSDPTINATTVYASPDVILNATSALLLGPLQVNSSFAMLSVTLPIINNTSAVDVLGYMTVIANAEMIYNVMTSREGLGNTGVVLLLGPSNLDNKFAPGTELSSANQTANKTALADASVNYILAPTPVAGQKDRHQSHDVGQPSKPFPLTDYPAALNAFTKKNTAANLASSDLSTTNEEGINVAVGYARPQNQLADWVLIVEQEHSEAWEPVVRLRNILLACVFGTAGFIALLIFPIAHFGVRPIRRLRDATEKSIQPPGYTPTGSIFSETLEDGAAYSGDEEAVVSRSSEKKSGFWVKLRNIRRGGRQRSKAERAEDARRRVFKIPGKVQDRKHFITDELTELTGIFNEMSEELMLQYGRLEERVAERTHELEISKKAAEAANESKTLFIANISHELKTPLNGILGMCAVCMGEDDLPRIKKSLQVVYKSGDLLLHLLNDLLTFSKNQIGQQLSLEEKEFRLSDIRSQITTIFDKQVREGNINFGVNFLSTDTDDFSPIRPNEKALPALGPLGTGRLKDMSLWGDQHRILQVIINLVSNSLKFTPVGGRVEVRIKCIGEVERSRDGSRKSMNSNAGSQRPSRHRRRVGSDSSKTSRVPSSSSKQGGTALLINPMDPKATPHIQVRERSPTPPPIGSKTLLFEFEVEDTGPGISENFQTQVFEPFVQADLGLSKKYGGTGLGLSICSQLAGLMGGEITLKSTVGVGSTFTMRIPLKFVKERASSTTSSSLHGSRPTSTYTVSDETRGPAHAPRNSGDAGSNGPAIDTGGNPVGFEKDVQPRLVGLSQPFFASPPHVSSVVTKEDQLAALDRVAATKDGGNKIRVLVAEDNLVNQEVVLRYVIVGSSMHRFN